MDPRANQSIAGSPVAKGWPYKRSLRSLGCKEIYCTLSPQATFAPPFYFPSCMYFPIKPSLRSRSAEEIETL